jgi:hypothetical protein
MDSRSAPIVILLGAPLTAQNFERIGVPYLSKCFDVIIFDCTGLLSRKDKSHSLAFSNHTRIAINTEVEFEAQIQKFSPKYAVDFIGFCEHSLQIFKILARNNTTLVIQRTGTLPIPTITFRLKSIFSSLRFAQQKTILSAGAKERNYSQNILKLLKRIAKLCHQLNLKFKQLFTFIFLIKNPDFVCLVAGNESLDKILRISTTKIWIRSNDHHTFASEKDKLIKNSSNLIAHPFILFIDDALVNASDWSLLDIPPPVSESNYNSNLINFFEHIELIHGVPVIIAGHPNSEIDQDYATKMGGRAVIYGKTASLVLQSKLVLFHGSTAVSFAVLAKKPIISLTSRELNGSSYGVHVRFMSKILGTQLIFIDIPYCRSVLKENVIDESKYIMYESNYLSNSLSKETKPWEAFINFVNENNG